MCGIVGIFNYKTKQPIDRYRLKGASDLLIHRGPDGEGFYYDDNNGIGLANRRLSIIDLVTGDQPISNEDESIWIVYNGELYNYLELREYLIKKGHVFKTKSDTEVIVHAYEEFGIDCVKKFNGIFAFAIWDKNSQTLYLARDHFGVKPLYYLYDKERFIFASEIKAILRLVEEKQGINKEGLFQCLILRYTLAPETLFKSIKKLGPSEILHFNSEFGISIKNYWEKNLIIDYDKSESYWKDKLAYLYENAIKRQMISDVPIGLSLSGGVDSATILSIMSRYSNGNVKTFSVGFEGGKYEDNELDKAEYLSRLFGAEFYSALISESDYIDFFDKYLWYLEEPVGNESAIAYYFVAKLAQGTVKVLLNGQGADEPFGGYDRYIGAYHADTKPWLTENLIKITSVIRPLKYRKYQILKLNEYASTTDLHEKVLNAASLLTLNLRNKIINKETINNTYYNLKEKTRVIINNITSKIGTEKLFFYDLFSSLPENLLLCEDKLAMAAGIEARVPFLDVELVETTLSIPAQYKIGLFSGKKIHKKVAEKFVDKKIAHQRKIGFNNPVEKWLRNRLGNELEDLINSHDSITRNYLNIKYINKMVSDHKASKFNHEKFLFLLLSIEKWNKLFLLR